MTNKYETFQPFLLEKSSLFEHTSFERISYTRIIFIQGKNMVFKGLGITAVSVALISIPLSTTFGASSIIAFYLVLSAMLVASLATAVSGKNYFLPSFVIACINVLGFNDGTKIHQISTSTDWLYISSMYAIFIVIAVLSFIFSRKDNAIVTNPYRGL